LPVTGNPTSCRAAEIRRVSSRRVCLRSCQSRSQESTGAAHEEDDVPDVNPQTLSLVPHRGHDVPVCRTACRDTCAVDTATEWHHARLTRVEDDQDALLELLELAITWHELEYAESGIVTPDRWMAFVESHRWTDPERVERIFSLATDVVMMAELAVRQRPGGPAQ
jgi:hypothetical protein